MTAAQPDSTDYVVVARRPDDRWRRFAVLAGWPLSLLLLWAWMDYSAEPELTALRVEHAALQERDRATAVALEASRQEATTLRRSDQISRAANLDVQQTLGERDEEVAALRADVEFYERLVGATGQRRGLSVHAVDFQPEAGGSWRYLLTLTQNLNRGAVSAGRLRFAVEGVADGRLQTIEWKALRGEDAGQAYSFRYFQRLEGSIVLPAGFTPQRVKVRLDGSGPPVDAVLPWPSAPAAS